MLLLQYREDVVQEPLQAVSVRWPAQGAHIEQCRFSSSVVEHRCGQATVIAQVVRGAELLLGYAQGNQFVLIVRCGEDEIGGLACGDLETLHTCRFHLQHQFLRHVARNAQRPLPHDELRIVLVQHHLQRSAVRRRDVLRHFQMVDQHQVVLRQGLGHRIAQEGAVVAVAVEGRAQHQALQEVEGRARPLDRNAEVTLERDPTAQFGFVVGISVLQQGEERNIEVRREVLQ